VIGNVIKLRWLCTGLVLAVLGVTASVPLISHAAFQSHNSSQPLTIKQKGLEFVPGEILVRFRAESISATKTAEVAQLSVNGKAQISIHLERLKDPEIIEGLRLARVAPEEMAEALTALRLRDDVIYAEPNYIRRALKTPNDPRYPQMWGLKNIGQASTFGGNPGTPGNDVRAEPAWELTTGSKSVVVGIIDEGIDINHEDLD